MKKHLLFLGLVSYSLAASQNNQVYNKVQQKLTNGNVKTWKFLKTVETMGNEKESANSCNFKTLTFKLSDKSYVGNFCDERKAVNSIWKLEGKDEDEVFISLDTKYMLDIYTGKVNGKNVEFLRLKLGSHRKMMSSTGYIFTAAN